MRIYKIVIDTNVIISALRSKRGASYKLVSNIDSDKFIANISVPLLIEYESVAKRGELEVTNQAIDDILDFSGDEEQIGKPVANDLRQGIATLPVMLFDQKEPKHPTILKAVRREKVSDEEILEIVELIRSSGCVDASVDEARRYAQQAQASLETLPDNPYRQAMHGLAEYTVTRDI